MGLRQQLPITTPNRDQSWSIQAELVNLGELIASAITAWSMVKIKVALLSNADLSLGMSRYAYNLGVTLRSLGADVDYWVVDTLRSFIAKTSGNPIHPYNRLGGRFIERPMVPLPLLKRTISRFVEHICHMAIRKLRKLRYDVFHVVHHCEPYLIKHLPKFFKNIVLTCHDFMPLRLGSIKDYYGLWQIQRRLIRHYEHFGAIIVPSDFTRQEYFRFVKSRRRINVVPWGVDPVFRPLEKEVSRLELGLPTTHKLILYVGTSDPRRQVWILPLILQAVRRHFGKTMLVLVGDSGLLRLRSEHIIVFNRVTDEALVRLYNSADIFVFPTLYEGFGFQPLEAMACGVPVVSTKLSSIPEICKDAAMLVDDPIDSGSYAEMIISCLEDTRLSDELRRKGMARAKEFSWDRTAKTTMRVYHEVGS